MGPTAQPAITLQDELITVGVLDNENEVLNFLGVTNESIGMNSFDGDGNWTRIGIGGEFTPLGEDSASMSAVDLQNGAVSFIGLDSEVIVNSTANWQTNEYSVTTQNASGIVSIVQDDVTGEFSETTQTATFIEGIVQDDVTGETSVISQSATSGGIELKGQVDNPSFDPESESGPTSDETVEGQRALIAVETDEEDNTTARVTVTNKETGNDHGLYVGERDTVLSGGTNSTSMTLNDTGATFSNGNGGPARVTGVADGKSKYDAVNYGQLQDLEDDLSKGIAISYALEVMLPDPGKSFRMTVGGGFYNGESALGLTGAGRVTENTALYFWYWY